MAIWYSTAGIESDIPYYFDILTVVKTDLLNRFLTIPAPQGLVYFVKMIYVIDFPTRKGDRDPAEPKTSAVKVA